MIIFLIDCHTDSGEERLDSDANIGVRSFKWFEKSPNEVKDVLTKHSIILLEVLEFDWKAYPMGQRNSDHDNLLMVSPADEKACFFNTKEAIMGK